MKREWWEIALAVVLMVVGVVLPTTCLVMDLSSKKDIRKSVTMDAEPNDTTGACPFESSDSTEPETSTETEEDLDNEIPDAEALKQELLDHMSSDSYELAKFLFYMGALDDFSETRPLVSLRFPVLEAAHLFSNDEELRLRALARAREISDQAQVTLTKPEEVPIAIAADTGEPISSEPGRPWAGPTD